MARPFRATGGSHTAVTFIVQVEASAHSMAFGAAAASNVAPFTKPKQRPGQSDDFSSTALSALAPAAPAAPAETEAAEIAKPWLVLPCLFVCLFVWLFVCLFVFVCLIFFGGFWVFFFVFFWPPQSECRQHASSSIR